MAPAEEPRTEFTESARPQQAGARVPRPYKRLGLGILAVGCLALVSARIVGRSRVQPKNTGERRILYYTDPMHPDYRSDRPGKAPDCGMDLAPVFAGDKPANRETASRGTIVLSPRQEQAIQIQTETLQTTLGRRRVRTLGRVVPDEALISDVSAGVDGWVRSVSDDATGTQVRQGQNLATFYSRDMSSPQQAYVYALESYTRLKETAAPQAGPLALAARQLAAARESLEFFGMGEQQIEQLGRTGNEISEIHLTAPAGGRILERNLAPGQRFMKGQILYRIANLSRVWVLADVYPQDAPSARDIRSVRIRADGLPAVEAHLAKVPLRFDGASPVGRLRAIVENADGSLVPGMFVEVTLEFAERPAMTLHTDAVLDSGTKKRVFVALGDGRYEMREVETGRRDDDRLEIRSGLREGDRVVSAGAFLLDSESRIRNPKP